MEIELQDATPPGSIRKFGLIFPQLCCGLIIGDPLWGREKKLEISLTPERVIYH